MVFLPIRVGPNQVLPSPRLFVGGGREMSGFAKLASEIEFPALQTKLSWPSSAVVAIDKGH